MAERYITWASILQGLSTKPGDPAGKQADAPRPIYAVDLDATLAKYHGFKGPEHIGRPIPLMVQRIKRWLRDGDKRVQIFTARANEPRAVEAIRKWCKEHVGHTFKVTNVKTQAMKKIYDDRATAVRKNTGERKHAQVADPFSEFDPRMRDKLKAIIAQLKQQKYDAYIPKGSGRRTAAEQLEKVRQGFSRAKIGPHNYGLAADIVPRTMGWKAPQTYWSALGAAAKAQGLTWGGGFKRFKDVAHVEYPAWQKNIAAQPAPGTAVLPAGSTLSHLAKQHNVPVQTLISLNKPQYPDPTKIPANAVIRLTKGGAVVAADNMKLEITGSGDGMHGLLRLLGKCYRDGMAGHSFGIKTDDNRCTTGWDGDGSDNLQYIKVNGKRLTKQQLKTLIEKRATEAPTAEQVAAAAKATDTKPTEAQKDEGNYAKGHIRVHGLQITIENAKGSVRKGKNAKGETWQNTLTAHYGYIKGKGLAKDGDQVDVFIGPDPKSWMVYVVNQVNPETKKFDEFKVVFGCKTKKEAEALYLSNYVKGWQGLGNIVSMFIPAFKKWLTNGDKQHAVSSTGERITGQLSEKLGDGGHADTHSTGNRAERIACLSHTFRTSSVPATVSPTKIAGADSVSDKGFANGRTAPIEVRGNACHSPALGTKCGSLFNRPMSFDMRTHMDSLAHNLKVDGIVIKPVTIAMVHNFLTCKRASQDVLHNNPMFQALAASDANQSVGRTVIRKQANMSSSGRPSSGHMISPFEELKYILGCKKASKKAADDADYAPGLPEKGMVGEPTKDLVPGQLATYVLQRHQTVRQPNREHFDLRLGTPATGLFSWAVPKARLPEPGERRLAPQTEVHRYEYGGFTGRLGKGYGEGVVEMADKGQALVRKVTPNTLHFTIAHSRIPQRYTLINTRSGRNQRDWLLINQTIQQGPAAVGTKPNIRLLSAENLDAAIDQAHEVQAKIDGASSVVEVTPKGEIESYSVRKRTTGEPIVHTERLGLYGQSAPELKNTVLRGEIYGLRKGKAIPFKDVAGILNSTIAKSRATQEATDTQMQTALFDVLKHKGVDVSQQPQPERRALLNAIAGRLSPEHFHVVPGETSSEGKRQLVEAIRTGKHPLTSEGVILHMPGGQTLKHKNFQEKTVYLTGVYPGEGRRVATAGGLLASTRPDGKGPPIRIGTGFSDAELKNIVDNLKQYRGQPVRVQHQGQFEGTGLLRAPSFKGFETESEVKKAVAHGEVPVILQVMAKTGELKAEIRAEIADTPETRRRGLSYRDELADGCGMLFDKAGAFWMKGVRFPLDIVFLDKQGEILEWQHMPRVADDDPLKPLYVPENNRAACALELPAGWYGQKGLTIGDRIKVAEQVRVC